MATQVWTGALSTDPTVAGNWVSLTAPVTGDTVLFGNGTGALQNPVTFAADSIVFGAIDCTGYTSTMTVSSHALKCSGSVTLPNGMTFTSNSTSSLVLSGTGTVTTGSMINLPQTVTINAPGATVTQGSAWTLAGTTSGVLTLTNATSFVCAFNINAGKSAQTGGTFTASGSPTFTFSGSATAFNVSGGAWTKATETIVMSGAGVTFAGFNLSYATVQLTGSGAATVSGTGTFVNLTRTGTAVKTDSLVLSANQTVTGTITLGGNTQSGVNRLLVDSSVIGTQRVITATGAAVVINGDVDFEDIAFSGSPSWTNTAGGGSFVGDCGGNGALIGSNITQADTFNFTNTSGGNWSLNTNWGTGSVHSSAARVPLPQDTVTLNTVFTTSRTVTADMPRLGGSIDWTGATFTTALTYSLTITPTNYGSLTLLSTAGFVLSGPQRWTFAGRGSYNINMQGAAFTFAFTLAAPGGTYTLQSDISVPGASATTFNNGTFDANGHNVSTPILNVSGAFTTLKFGSGNWMFTGTGTILGFVSGASVTGSPTLIIGDSSSSSKTLSLPSGLSLGTISYTNAGTGSLILTYLGALTLAGLTVTGAVRTLSITHGQTLTLSACSLSGPVTVTSDTSAAATFRTADGRFLCSVTTALAEFSALSWTTGSPIATLVSTHTFNATAFVVRGASGALATLNASVGGSAATLTMATGAFALADYCTVTDITANRLLDRYAAIGTGTSGVTIDHGLLTEVGAG